MNEPEWIVEAPTEALEALEQSFFNGPIDERGLSPLLEKKIAQIKGLKVDLFSPTNTRRLISVFPIKVK